METITIKFSIGDIVFRPTTELYGKVIGYTVEADFKETTPVIRYRIEFETEEETTWLYVQESFLHGPCDQNLEHWRKGYEKQTGKLTNLEQDILAANKERDKESDEDKR